MPTIVWSDKLSVKIRRFDNEHKHLIALINDLHNAVSYGEGGMALGRMLSELASCTQDHFEHEEQVMRKYNFPGLDAHREAHQAFVRRVADTYNKGGIAQAVPLFDFATTWIQDHIMRMDTEYSEFLIKAGAK